MARNLEYKLILDAAGFKRGAQDAAQSVEQLDKKLDHASATTEKWGNAQQRAAMRMEAAHETALKMNASLAGTNDKAAALAATLDRTGSTIDGVAKSMGVNTQATQAFGAASDIASIGVQGLTKSMVGFNLATLTVVGAGASLGLMIGGWLDKFEAVRKTVDGLLHPFAQLVGLAGQVNVAAMTGIGDFSAQMKASNEQAIRTRVEAAKAQGQSLETILDNNKGISKELAAQLGLTKENVKAEKERVAAAKKLADSQREFTERVKRMASDKMIEEMAGLLNPVRGDKDFERMLALSGPKKGATAAGMVDAFTKSRLPGESLLDQIKAREQIVPVKATMDWAQTLEDLANQLQILDKVCGGVLGKISGLAMGIAGGVSGIMAGKGTFDKGSEAGGIGGLLGKITGVGGMIAGGIGIAKSIVNLFKGDPVKKAEKEAGKALGMNISKEMAQAFMEEAKRTGKSVSAVAKEWLDAQRKELRSQGLGQMGQGVDSLLGLLGTNEDITRIAAGNFATLFWETVKDKGWPEAVAAFDSQIDKLKSHFGDNLPSSIASIVGLSNIAKNEQVSPYLQAASAQGQFVTGAMNAGIYSTGMQDDSVKIAQQTVGQLRQNGATDQQAYQAIGSLLQANVNAALASGRGISRDLQALLDEARNNGVDIVADINVQQLEVLRAIYAQLGGLGAPGSTGGTGDTGGSASTGTPSGIRQGEFNPGGGDGPMIPERWMADGGIVTKPTVVGVGEAGPEAIVPLRRAGGMGGLTLAPQFNMGPLGTQASQKQLARWMMKEFFRQAENSPTLRQKFRTNGGRYGG